MTVTIRSQDEYRTALTRIRALRTSPATVAETSELKALLGAADDWHRNSGGEAAGERDDLAALSVQISSTFALGMASRFPGTDWVADLADLLGKKRDYVEWHLQHDVMPPEDLLLAALRLIEGERPSQRRAAEEGVERSPPGTEAPPPLPSDSCAISVSDAASRWRMRHACRRSTDSSASGLEYRPHHRPQATPEAAPHLGDQDTAAARTSCA
ncbi:hypothetical protein OIU35_13835 [Boseaceae bacterium BT-24-1]|nr:hypothetical protein [Boseaceae bacterium BT-24-1]